MFLIFHLERPDVISGGDLGHPQGDPDRVRAGGDADAGSECVEIGERWRPHRSLASIYLWESLAGDVTVGGT